MEQDAHAAGEDPVGDHTSRAFEPVTFFIVAYLSSAVAQQVTLMCPKRIRVPHSICLYLVGLALGRIAVKHASGTEFGKSIISIMNIDPHVIFWILLPALLFEDSAGVHWHVFRRVCPNALLLAVPGVIVNTVLTGLFVKVAFTQIEWTWSTALLLGSVLSATDPVAVVGALHQLSAPDKLASLISGESLFNDGSAVVLFNLFWDLARGIREFEFGYGVFFFLQMALGGPLLALLVSLVAYTWLRRTERFEIELLIVLVAIYGLFFLAEHPAIQVSGVLAVVCFGCFMAATGRFALAIDLEHEHHAVMSFLGLLSNEAIFLIAGAVSYRFGSLDSEKGLGLGDYLECAALYAVVHLTRAGVLALFWPLLRQSGYGLTWREAAVCVWGGLRGAVGLAMALLVEHDPRLDEATRVRIAFHTSGIVFGTLLINGTTVTMVYRRLHVYGKAEHHDRLLEVALQRVDDAVQKHALNLREHWFFHNCHFDLALQLLPLLSSQEEPCRSPQQTRSRLHTTCADVDRVIEKLAQRITQAEAEQRIAQKILCQFRRSNLMSGNAFLVDSHLAAETFKDEEFALAMRITANDESDSEEAELLQEALHLRQRLQEERDQQRMLLDLPGVAREASKGSVASRTRGGPPKPAEEPPCLFGVVADAPCTREESGGGGEPAQLNRKQELRQQLARRRWCWVSRRVLRTIRMMKHLREEGSVSKREMMSRSKSKSSVAHFLEQCQDEASMMEVFQTIVNAARATYKSMFKAQSLSADPYRILMESLDVQEEVICLFHACSSGRSKSSDSLNTNTGSGFEEGWGFVRATLGRPVGYAFWLATRFFPVENWLEAQWWLLKRDAEVVTAYVMTQEHIMEMLEVCSKFPAEVEVPMKTITEEAKKQALFSLVREPYDGAMLALFEHVLLARLLVRAQWQLVEQLQKEGALLEEDAGQLIRNVIRPTEKALFEYTPTADHLERIGSTRAKVYTQNCFKRWLMRLVRRLEFHEAE